MAADSQGSYNGAKVALADPKIVRIGKLLFAADGSFAISHALRHFMIPPKVDQGPLETWLARDLVPWLRNHLKDHGGLFKRSEQDELPGQMIVARGAEWRMVDGGGSVFKLAQPWWAIGSGAGEARGALHALTTEHELVGPYVKDAKRAAIHAVHAACALDDGCSGPVTVEWTEA